MSATQARSAMRFTRRLVQFLPKLTAAAIALAGVALFFNTTAHAQLQSPAITTLSPASAIAGGLTFTLSVNGTGFVSGATVNLNGSSRLTTFVSATQLSAVINAGDIALAGWDQITVTNPGGVASNAVVFAITVGSISPTIGTALNYVPVSPCRLVDTRPSNGPNGAFAGPSISGGTSRDFTIPQNSTCNIPSTAAAYSLNVAVVPSGPLGFLTLWPAGQTQPGVATVSSIDGRVRSNAAIVPAGTNGAISVFASNTTDFVMDIYGYFTTDPTALQFYPVTPCRVVDTRNSSGALGGPSIPGNTSRTFPLPTGPCNLPATAKAYSLNLAVVPQQPLGYLTAWPTGQPQPPTANLSSTTGTVTASAAIVPTGTSGSIDVNASNSTDLIIDVNGYFASPGTGGLSLYNLTPCRLLDTRNPSNGAAGTGQAYSGELDENIQASACGVPVGSQAYVLNATVVPPVPLGYLTLWPQGTTQPLAATLSAVDATVTSNLAIVPTTNGSISTYASNPTQLILDLSGYFAPSAFTIGGTITGLSGTGLVLRDNGGNDLSASEGATSFTFTTPIVSGGTYNVTVFSQPTNPAQHCGVTNGSGTVSANITNVLVTCTTIPTFTIGGTVSGLSGMGLVLQDNGGNNLSVSANGSFTFTTAIASGASYNVTVLTQPSSPAQTCGVTSGSGTVTSTNVTSVQVNCGVTFIPILDITLTALGQKITPIDLSLYVEGGTGPFTFAVTAQTSLDSVVCSISGTQLVSDHGYHPGTNTVTVTVADAAQKTAQTTVNIIVSVPTVTYQLYGIDYSPYVGSQNPNFGNAVGDDQLIQQIGAIAPYTKSIRTFGCTSGLQDAAGIAKRFGLKVFIGVWIGTDPTANNTELQNCITVAQTVQVDAMIIGSEALLRNDVTPAQLIAYLNQFRAAVPNVPITTADTYLTLLNNPAVVAVCDFVFANYYPYWEGSDISKAVASLNAEDALLRATYAPKEVIVSETGWPSFGNIVSSAVPSLQNATYYFLDFESWVQAEQRKSFYFEDHDEPWKGSDDGWGIWDQNLVMKSGMTDVFNGVTMPDNWTCNAVPGGSGTPTLQFTSVPPLGSSANLNGQEWHAIPSDYYVVIYTHVGSYGWSVKPYAASPLTTIACDGTWSANIVSGGNDAIADQITAFLIPKTYSPPILLGAGTLPAELYTNAVASITVNR